ncbi:hypothetical protein EDB84DRAFT_1567254 [Lactarius hengduanensis]|nr:hypothetical protein EDB84DRAFT_1567254 [Lactarius hengduanensis]
MPAAARPLPSPRRPASGAHEGTPPHFSASLPPLPLLLPLPSCPRHPPFARKEVCEGNAPSRGAPFAREGAHEAKPSPPPHVSRSRAGTAQKVSPPPTYNPPPLRPPRRAPPPPSFARTGTQKGHAPAPPCPCMQEGGQRAHRVPWRGRRQPSPTPPTHARGGTARPPSPLRAGDASPATRTSHRTARARKGRGRRIQPLRTGYAGPVFTRPAMHVDAGGSVRPAQPLPRRVHLPVYAEARARGPHANAHAKGHGMRDGATRGANGGAAQRVCGQGEAGRGATRVPGGAACERRGVRIGAEV